MAIPSQNQEKKSNIEKLSEPFRALEVARNTYSTVSEYNTSHPNALSDGDILGKGENNGQVGSSIDILTRNGLLAKNKYNPNHEYDAYN